MPSACAKSGFSPRKSCARAEVDARWLLSEGARSLVRVLLRCLTPPAHGNTGGFPHGIFVEERRHPAAAPTPELDQLGMARLRRGGLRRHGRWILACGTVVLAPGMRSLQLFIGARLSLALELELEEATVVAYREPPNCVADTEPKGTE